MTSGCLNGALFPRPWSQEPGTGKGSMCVCVCCVWVHVLQQGTTGPARRKLQGAGPLEHGGCCNREQAADTERGAQDILRQGGEVAADRQEGLGWQGPRRHTWVPQKWGWDSPRQTGNQGRGGELLGTPQIHITGQTFFKGTIGVGREGWW